MKVLRKIWQIIFWVILVVVAIYCTSIIIGKVFFKDKTPSFFGYKNFIVLTGSMSPTIKEGDIVVVKVTKDIEENDIISFKVENSVVTHRVIDIKYIDGEKIFITKGDHNNGIDDELIKESDIEGKYSFKIPFLGKVILFLKTPIGLIVLLAVLGLALFINTIRPDRLEVKDKKLKDEKEVTSKDKSND